MDSPLQKSLFVCNFKLRQQSAGCYAIALLAGGTICYEMLTHFKNRTAAIS
jgi:hypothetical protein